MLYQKFWKGLQKTLNCPVNNDKKIVFNPL